MVHEDRTIFQLLSVPKTSSVGGETASEWTGRLVDSLGAGCQLPELVAFRSRSLTCPIAMSITRLAASLKSRGFGVLGHACVNSPGFSPRAFTAASGSGPYASTFSLGAMTAAT